MANLTREQVVKINSKCQNGFRLDIQTAVIWGKKELVKEICLDDSGVIYRLRIRYAAKYEHYSEVGVYPVLELDKLVPTGTEKVYKIIDCGQKELGELVKRRSVKALQDLTANYPDEKAISLIREAIVA